MSESRIFTADTDFADFGSFGVFNGFGELVGVKLGFHFVSTNLRVKLTPMGQHLPAL